MYKDRIKHLEQLHESLNKQIDTLSKTGKFDDNQMSNLKKQKLQVLDQLSDLRRRQYAEHEYVNMDDDR